MPKKPNDSITPTWVEGELRLAGTLDSRMIGLLRAIDQSGSINQAAKQTGLSYKGAWQMIERANNLAPKVLITTATGGSKGGGTCLTTAGQSLLQLFTRLEQQHRQFLQQLNQNLADDPDVRMLLKRLVIKTSATNQLFGTITAFQTGAVNAEVLVELKGGEQIVASLALTELKRLELSIGSDVLLLINDPEIIVITDLGNYPLSARNCLRGTVIRVQYDGVDSEIVINLPSGDSLVATISQVSALALGLNPGISAYAVFKSNAVILGAISHGEVQPLTK
ncbi:MAG: TOBE domain-containing protein [Methylococcaceae bacterium]|nr:TOBE domain-containing protein [Methylococcaceae bacterium]